MSDALLTTSHIDKSLKGDSGKSFSDYYKVLHLSILLGQDGFSFSVMEPEQNKHLALVSYRIEKAEDSEEVAHAIDRIFGENQLLQRFYPQVNVLYESTKSTLIPSPLFDPAELKTYLKFNHKVLKQEEVYYDKLQNLEAVNVYAIPVILRSKLKEKFTRINLVNYNSSLIETLLISNKNVWLENTVFVNVRRSQFDMIYILGDKLVFSNTFNYRTPEDFAYFLLFTLNQLGMNPESVVAVLLGEIDKNSPLWEIAWKYIRNMELLGRNDFFKYSYVFDDLPENHFYNLLNFSLCGL